jgi:hypothetical protein
MARMNSRAWLVTGVISAFGAIGGCIAAVILTFVMNWIFGAPALPTSAVYWWNIRIFALLGAVLGPVLAWAGLRNVPLWRTIFDPAVAAVGASILSGLVVPMGFAVLVPLAVIMAAVRLNRIYGRRVKKAQALQPAMAPEIRP